MLHVVTIFCVILRFNVVRIIFETAKIMRTETEKIIFSVFPPHKDKISRKIKE
mgnify:CR=1 FL=1